MQAGVGLLRRTRCFVCFATNAVHIELISSLRMKTFIGKLKRFMTHRDHCKTTDCVNATNFIEAKKELEELMDTLYSQEIA